MTTPDQALASRVAHAELMKRVLIVVTAIMVAIVLVLLLILISQIRATQQEGSPVLRAIQAQQGDIKRAADSASSTNEQVLDCLRPEGVCFKRSQQQTGDVVASINEISQYAAACADRPGSQSLDEIRRCIADLITAADSAGADPAP
jgi:hypothetical protein